MRFYILRHGETALNAKRVMQGRLDEPLDEKGKELAAITGRAMKGIRFDRCISSPLKRASQTAEIILRESAQARERLPEDRDKVREVLSDISGYAGVIDTAGKNLLDIINGILDISRIEAGKLEIRESEYRLSSVLNDVCSMIRFRARSRNLSFLADVSGQLPDRLGRLERDDEVSCAVCNKR